MKLPRLKVLLEPYRDILQFVFLFLCTHFFWKFTVSGDEISNDAVFWFAWNVTAPFAFLSEHIAQVVHASIAFFTPNIWIENTNTLRFLDGNAVTIVWSCTAIKQSVIFLIIFLFARGRHIHKLWFVPLGLLCTYIFNILRITAIVAFTMNHPTWFDFLHEYLFKYAFYGMFFLLWVWWNECYNVLESN